MFCFEHRDAIAYGLSAALQVSAVYYYWRHHRLKRAPHSHYAWLGLSSVPYAGPAVALAVVARRELAWKHLVVAAILAAIIVPRSTAYHVWLPLQDVELVVILEYAGLVTAALGRQSIFHLVMGAGSTFAFALVMAAGAREMRLHHFCVGQLLLLLPGYAAKVLGLFLAVDGWAQLVVNVREGTTLIPYGCDNVLAEHWLLLLHSGGRALLVESLARMYTLPPPLLYQNNGPRKDAGLDTLAGAVPRAGAAGREAGGGGPLDSLV